MRNLSRPRDYCERIDLRLTSGVKSPVFVTGMYNSTQSTMLPLRHARRNARALRACLSVYG